MFRFAFIIPLDLMRQQELQQRNSRNVIHEHEYFPRANRRNIQEEIRRQPGRIVLRVSGSSNSNYHIDFLVSYAQPFGTSWDIESVSGSRVYSESPDPFAYPSAWEMNQEPKKYNPIVKKQLDGKNNECPILFRKIKYGDYYLQCSCCKYNFRKESIQQHLQENDTCPMCRSIWTDHNVYVNVNAQVWEKRIKRKLNNKTIDEINQIVCMNPIYKPVELFIKPRYTNLKN